MKRGETLRQRVNVESNGRMATEIQNRAGIKRLHFDWAPFISSRPGRRRLPFRPNAGATHSPNHSQAHTTHPPQFAMASSVFEDEPVQTEFATYEDYLDSQIKPEDMFYLGVRQFFVFAHARCHPYAGRRILPFRRAPRRLAFFCVCMIMSH
jgi:hypothetical protein